MLLLQLPWGVSRALYGSWEGAGVAGVSVLVKGLMGSGRRWYHFPSVLLPPRCSDRQLQQQDRWGEVQIFPLPHFTSGRPRLERQYLQKRGHQSALTTFNLTTSASDSCLESSGGWNMHVLSGRERSVCGNSLSNSNESTVSYYVSSTCRSVTKLSVRSEHLN